MGGIFKMAAPVSSVELGPSELGTKNYWDTAYQRELNNFKENGDVGEVWFGYDSVERIIEWLEESPLASEEHSILDLGCGNGVLLMELHRAGFKKLTGVDYVQAAIDLAKAVAKDEGMDREITYQQADILGDFSSSENIMSSSTFDICIDKGTYDAICLNPDDPDGSRKKYIDNVTRLLKSPGLFIITSCNFTEEELISHFTPDFTFTDKIKVPTFMFGGKTGNRETQLIFVKKGDSS